MPFDLKENYPREVKNLLDKYLIDVNNYEIEIGYRADNNYFHFPEAFIRSRITIIH